MCVLGVIQGYFHPYIFTSVYKYVNPPQILVCSNGLVGEIYIYIKNSAHLCEEQENIAFRQ